MAKVSITAVKKLLEEDKRLVLRIIAEQKSVIEKEYTTKKNKFLQEFECKVLQLLEDESGGEFFKAAKNESIVCNYYIDTRKNTSNDMNYIKLQLKEAAIKKQYAELERTITLQGACDDLLEQIAALRKGDINV